MDWNNYKRNFHHYAKFHNKNDAYIELCLRYAKRLYESRLPVIYDQIHFSKLVGYKLDYLIKVSNSQEPFYREFQIPKKNKDKYRKISEPLPNLKAIQRWILDEILYKLEPSSYSKAFRKGYSIKDNARFHRKQNKVMSMDIQDYFSSITAKSVYSFFRNIGYAKDVSSMIANVCTLNDSLPQGAPTSPMLSNLITIQLDKRIAGYAIKNNIRYTRYADDLSFSGNFDEGKTIKVIKAILKSEGFKINESKTRVRKQNQQQEVTGIVVNEKLQAPRKYRKAFRQNVYYIKKFGLDSHLKFTGEENSEIGYLYKLLGMANFILNTNQNDIKVKEDYEYLQTLLSDYK